MKITRPLPRAILAGCTGLLLAHGAGCGNSSGGGGAGTGGAGGGFHIGGAPGSGGTVASGGSGGAGGCVPDYACTPVSPNTGDPVADCVARVNQFRACVCLPPLARWADGEACADQDAQYDSQNVAHAGAAANICDWGNAQDECPGWKGYTPESVVDQCLLQMFKEGPPPSGSCTGQCYTDHGHYINMTGTGYKNGIACGFYTTSGGAVWATQNFK